MNPACSSAGAGKVREALGKLKWMVNVNLYDNETASFWRGPGMKPEKIKTEVFLLPCCSSIEKEHFNPPAGSGDIRHRAYRSVHARCEILNELYFRVKQFY
jgi:formate dehydrogenase major subunit